jgi:O-antigen/teichoic acid export membrane protein
VRTAIQPGESTFAHRRPLCKIGPQGCIQPAKTYRIHNMPEETPDGRGVVTLKLRRNIVSSLIRVGVTGLVALLLPAFLTTRLSPSVYGAWVLILQLGAYVSFLDLGIQTGVAKFVAEFDAKQDDIEAGRYASAGLVLASAAAVAGILLTLGLVWRVPVLFYSMPPQLYSEVRTSTLLVGISLSVVLLSSIFSAVFLGLQRYAVPMTITIAGRLLYAGAVIPVVLFHGSLIVMSISVAAVNIVTALAQYIAWRRLAAQIRISFSLADRHVVNRMLSYCFFLALWSAGMVCVSGLDLTIVGHFDYHETAYYSVAIMPAALVLLLASSALGPMLPASSALSTQRSPADMGALLISATRYSTTLLLLTGLPLIVCGFAILSRWVGPAYAAHSIGYLRVLVLATIVRNTCLPYATMVTATGQQRFATIATLAEAATNLISSIYLASRIGAIGVACGTLIGSCVSVLLHFAISIPSTSPVLPISRMRLSLQGFLRPASIAIPSLLVLRLDLGPAAQPGIDAIYMALWAATTLCIAYFVVLDPKERRAVRSHMLPAARRVPST